MAPGRRQLTDAEAARFSKDRVLGQDWPQARPGPISHRVSARPGALQALIATLYARIGAGQTLGPITIGLEPGVHAGPVNLPDLAGAPAISLVGLGDASDVIIAAAIDGDMPATDYRARFGSLFAGAPAPISARFDEITKGHVIGTTNSAVLAIGAPGFHAANLTIRNLYACDRPPTRDDAEDAVLLPNGMYSNETHQALAVMATADGARFSNVTMSSFQDTLYLPTPGARAAFDGCTIEGDVDFIFGPGIGHFEGCTIRSRVIRSANSWATAPATPLDQRYGFVFEGCDFSHDDSPNARRGTFRLGRQWFKGARASPYADPAGCRLTDDISRDAILAVGKCVLRDCSIGPHIDRLSPWDDWKGPIRAPDGRLIAGPRHPRFRPVQFRLADIMAQLADWPDRDALGLGNFSPDEILLGEWKCE